jgi:hypothetical protein
MDTSLKLSKLDSFSWEFRLGASEKANPFECMPWTEEHANFELEVQEFFSPLHKESKFSEK